MNFQKLGNTCVVGLQWGDEGKGKIVDVLTEHFDVVVRYAGGANAGHTVRIGDQKFALHLVPSGILRPNVTCVIAAGVVLDPETLVREIDGLTARGVPVQEKLRISDRAHLVMPYHKKQDSLSEAALDSGRKLGTTSRGIGPCYADKMQRSMAFRVGDLLEADAFRQKLREVTAVKNRLFAALYDDKQPLDPDEIADTYLGFAARCAPSVTDTTHLLHQAAAEGKRLLFEGAQGTLLDIDHGTFPFVTSSNCSATGVAAGAGVPARTVHSYVGVIKAYCTRVGSGPFPTEQQNDIGRYIRERGQEFGTTTGRPRRCGWFDAFAARYSVMLGGITEVALMHLDTLAGLSEVNVCTGYRYRGRVLDYFTPNVRVLNEVEPVYETLPGWQATAVSWDSCEQLPAAARRYVERLEALIGAPITLVSVGADRAATLHRPGGLPRA